MGAGVGAVDNLEALLKRLCFGGRSLESQEESGRTAVRRENDDDAGLLISPSSSPPSSL